jgi:hypothetical protein
MRRASAAATGNPARLSNKVAVFLKCSGTQAEPDHRRSAKINGSLNHRPPDIGLGSSIPAARRIRRIAKI